MKRLEGYLDNGRGEPLADINVTASVLDTGAPVDMTATDDDGHWLFDSLPTAFEYLVTMTDTAGNAVSRAPWSGEMRELWVRDRLDVDGLPVLLDPAAGNALLWTATGLYVPPVPAAIDAWTKAESDLRYEPLDSAYTKAEADALFLTAAEADALFLTPAEGNAAYATSAHNHDATYVQLSGGSVMTGLLGPTSNNTRDLGTTALRWRKLWAVDGEFTNAPTVSGVAVLTATSAGLLYEPLDSAYTKAEDDARFVQLTGGSVMTGLLGPSTHNTRDLGTTGTRWRALYGMTGDLSTSLTVATKPVAISPDGSNIIEWRANGFYAAAGAVSDIWVNTGGDTMTGALVLPLGAVGTPSLTFASTLNTGVYSPGGDQVSVATAGVQRDLTDSTGRVWFNPIKPSQAPLYQGTLPSVIIQSEHTDGMALLNLQGYGMGNYGPYISLYRAKGTAASPTALTNNDYLSSLDMWGYAGGDFRHAVRLHGFVSGTPGATWAPGGMIVQLMNTSGTLTERLKIDSAGLVTLGSLQVNSRPVSMAGCRVYHNAAQTITTGTLTALAFNTERFDTDAFHDTVTNNSRLTVPTGLAGKYHIWACVEWGGVADTTWRNVGFRVNNTTHIGRSAMTNVNSLTFYTVQNPSVVWDLAVGDYVECCVRHERGSNLDVALSIGYNCEFGMQRVG